MEEEVAYRRERCNSRCVLNGSGEMTLIVHIDIANGSPVLQWKMMSGVSEWMDSLSGAPDKMDS